MKSKRILSFALAALLFINLAVLSMITAAAASATMTVGSAQGLKGSNVKISVKISPILSAKQSIAAMDFVLKYDKTKLEVVSAKTGSVLTGGFSEVNSKYSSGIKIVYASIDGFKSAGSLLDVVFKIKSTASGVISLSLSDVFLGDNSDNCNAIPHTVKSGSITVAPTTPTSLKAASASYNSIKVSWGAVSGATGYEIYRSTSKTGSYSLLKSLTSASYTNTSLTTGKTYYYKVRAYKGSSPKVYSAFTGFVSSKPILATPGSFTAAKASSTSIKTSWRAVSGANGYEVWRATSSTGTCSLIKTTTATTYTNTGLTKNKTYYYKVKAYRIVSNVKVYGAYTAVKSAKPY